MQGNLEDIIIKGRAEFDSKTPRKEIWDKIESKLDKAETKTINATAWYWKAAVIVLLGAVTFLVADRYTYRTQELAEVTTIEEFNELESFYTSLITSKELRVDDETSSDKFFTFLETDIEEIDALYSELKKTFEQEQETPAVLDALVHLLRQKLHLISSQLDLINDLKIKEGTADVEEGSAI